jgi:hypothetical protein
MDCLPSNLTLVDLRIAPARCHRALTPLRPQITPLTRALSVLTSLAQPFICFGIIAGATIAISWACSVCCHLLRVALCTGLASCLCAFASHKPTLACSGLFPFPSQTLPTLVTGVCLSLPRYEAALLASHGHTSLLETILEAPSQTSQSARCPGSPESGSTCAPGHTPQTRPDPFPRSPRPVPQQAVYGVTLVRFPVAGPGEVALERSLDYCTAQSLRNGAGQEGPGVLSRPTPYRHSRPLVESQSSLLPTCSTPWSYAAKAIYILGFYPQILLPQHPPCSLSVRPVFKPLLIFALVLQSHLQTFTSSHS